MMARHLQHDAHVEAFIIHCDMAQQDDHNITRLIHRSLRRRSAKMLRKALRSGPVVTVIDPGAAEYLASRGDGRILIPVDPGCLPVFAVRRELREALTHSHAA
jgi:hypothetical protein